MREDIPSVKLLVLIRENPGMSVDDLITNDKLNSNLKTSKENDLINDGFVIIKDGELELTFFGRTIAVIFKTYKKLLNIQEQTG